MVHSANHPKAGASAGQLPKAKLNNEARETISPRTKNRLINTIQIGVCDDDDDFLHKLSAILHGLMDTKELRYEIKGYNHPNKLLEAFGISGNGSKPAQETNPGDETEIDILFLDIEMPFMDGLSVAEELYAKRKETRIIFLTSHEEYMQKAFKVRPFRYLFKSGTVQQIKDVLKEALDDAVNELLDVDGIIVTDIDTRTMQFVRYDDIVQFESLEKLSAVYHHDTYTVTNKSLKYWLSAVDNRFFQCHQRYIVNMAKINRIDYEAKTIEFQNGKTTLLSVRKAKEIKKLFPKFVREHARKL